ncbi:hypothetical protein SAMN02745174_02604 [Cetobacterium ceti]|uniref:N-acetyltransferase domain-containing protein n=1 Tax=Cetobacterium ceti TaxID=180163 RepID=A0A1T4R701_9FUSO|nr:hypothetical protein [Cetobacterium ceti]SKA11840.1 hypothetical protein SAMN02745174_02604 [Cetobacterium ceti]
MNEFKIIKISDLLRYSKNEKDFKSVSNLIYKETIKLENKKEELIYNGNIEDLYKTINYLHRDYPCFEEWYFNKVVPELKENKREILLYFRPCKSGEKKLKLAALAILKNTNLEKKICTFRVSEEYRGEGIAKILFEECFDVLGTKTPLITISEARVKEFQKYIELYNFKCVQKKRGLYVEDKMEYIYNERID